MKTLQLRKVTQVINMKGTPQTVTLTKPVRYSTFSSENVIDLASENSGISRAMMSAAFYAIEQQIRQLVVNGHNVTLGQMGTFYVSTNAHAATDEEDAGAKAVYRIAVRFRQSKQLKSRISEGLMFSTALAGTLVPNEGDADTAGTGGSTDTGGSTGSGGSGSGDGGTLNPD